MVLAGLCLAGGILWWSLSTAPRAPLSPGPDLRALLESAPDWYGHDAEQADRALDLPADHAAHPKARAELWSLSGWLAPAHEVGAGIGFQLTLVRAALSAEPVGRESAWAAFQVYGASLSLIREGDPAAATDLRLSRDALGLAGSAGDPPRVWVRDWSIESSGDKLLLSAGSAESGLDLRLAPEKAALDRESLKLLPSAADRPQPGLYVIPRLRADGQVKLGGEVLDARGAVIMVHAWGSSAVGVAPGLGLDRFSLLLDDRREILCLRLRRAEGGGRPVPACAVVMPDGRVQTFSRREILLKETAHWRGQDRGAAYPVAWRLTLPLLDLALDLEPLARDQMSAGAARLWSGAVRVAGTQDGTPVSGNGRIETMAVAETEAAAPAGE